MFLPDAAHTKASFIAKLWGFSYGLSWEADELRKLNSNGVEYIHIRVATAGQFKATKSSGPLHSETTGI
jgi:hypothetical protein